MSDRSKVWHCVIALVESSWLLFSPFPFPPTHVTRHSLQIKAYIQCGKLKNAYLIAIKSRLIDEVKNISEIAGKAGQLAVRDICEKWLAQQTR